MGTKSDSNGNRNVPVKQNNWSLGLLQSMKDPNLIVFEDSQVVAIKDVYPKATFHYLVCPKCNIPTLKSVRSEHLSVLKHMAKIGGMLSNRHKGKTFLFGYHAVPSMVRLHLHVISDDFNSPYLKTKRHWNSFTTDYFRPSDVIIQELEKGKINHMSVIESKKLLSAPLKCNKCSYLPKNMPDLKKHIQIHS